MSAQWMKKCIRKSCSSCIIIIIFRHMTPIIPTHGQKLPQTNIVIHMLFRQKKLKKQKTLQINYCVCSSDSCVGQINLIVRLKPSIKRNDP